MSSSRSPKGWGEIGVGASWGLLGHLWCSKLFFDFFQFLLLKRRFWNTSLFFFDLWVALRAPRDGLICNPYTPAQSKPIFSFSHFFSKRASKRHHFGSILDAIFVQNCNFEWKGGFKKWFKNRVPPHTQTSPYDQAPRLPDSPPRVRVFLNKKQLSEQETETAAHFWVHFWDILLESVFSESTFWKMCICCWHLKEQIGRASCRERV